MRESPRGNVSDGGGGGLSPGAPVPTRAGLAGQSAATIATAGNPIPGRSAISTSPRASNPSAA